MRIAAAYFPDHMKAPADVEGGTSENRLARRNRNWTPERDGGESVY
jgi:hypothetical protein